MRLVSVEYDIIRVAIVGKHLADVLLLFGRQSAPAVLVAVVHAVVAEVGSELLAHTGVVLAQHLVVDMLETVGIFHHLFLLEILAIFAAARRRKYGSAYFYPIGDVFADGIIYAFFTLRTFGIEAKQVARTNLFKIKFVFHDIAKIIYFVAECKIYVVIISQKCCVPQKIIISKSCLTGNIINHKLVGNIEVAVKPKTGAIVVQVGACPAFIEQLQGL